MGNEDIHAASAKPEEIASYTIISFSGIYLPKQYEGMIYAKWMRSLRKGFDYFSLIEAMTYYGAYHNYIAILLGKPETVIRLAVLSDDHDVVLGFSVCRKNILDYILVLLPEYRRLKIGTSLIPNGIDTFTHLTRTGMTIWNNKYSEWKFNPFI